MVVDTFSSCIDPKTRLPCGWHPTRDDVSMFSVGTEQENFFTRIDTKGGCTTIGKKMSYSTKEYPVLTWQWRVHKLPEGGKETKRKRNDSGAAVYVIFKGHFKLNKIIKYIWSSSLPVGTVTSSPYNPRAKMIVLKSGATNTGEWITEKVNVLEDYKRVFGDNPPEVEAIAIMSDADNTNSSAMADYDDIIIESVN